MELAVIEWLWVGEVRIGIEVSEVRRQVNKGNKHNVLCISYRAMDKDSKN